MLVSPTEPNDIEGIKTVLESTGLFPSEMLPEMIRGYLSDTDSPEIWLTCSEDEHVVGFCYAAPEQLAEGTWNMLAIAVLNEVQGKGCGAALVTYLESQLAKQGQRIVIVETSGTEEFARTRAFYHKNGYDEEARIRDFWGPRDDKIVFWKSLV